MRPPAHGDGAETPGCAQSGDAITRPANDIAAVNAVNAGKTTFAWEVAGVLRREASVEVVAPSEVRKLEAFAIPDSATVVTDVETKAPWLSTTPLSRVEASSREQTTIVVAARLKDERIAIVALTGAELTPKVLGNVEAYSAGTFVLFPASPPVAGEGTVVVRADGLEASFDLVMR